MGLSRIKTSACLAREVKGSLPASIQEKVEGAVRKTSGSLVHPASGHLRFSGHSMGYARSPNKAPEPTSGSVTPRAISRISEMKPQHLNRHAARGAPAPLVAHL